MKAVSKKNEGNKLVAVIGDEDTVTGFLLTGIGQRNVKGQTNYYITDDKSTKQQVEGVFRKFLKNPNIAVILVTQDTSQKYVKTIINQWDEVYPVILQIPSKEKDYQGHKDSVLQRAHRLLYGSQISPDA